MPRSSSTRATLSASTPTRANTPNASRSHKKEGASGRLCSKLQRNVDTRILPFKGFFNPFNLFRFGGRTFFQPSLQEFGRVILITLPIVAYLKLLILVSQEEFVMMPQETLNPAAHFKSRERIFTLLRIHLHDGIHKWTEQSSE